MKCNTGKVDRIIRIVLGLAIITWGVMSQNWLGAIGLIPLGTGLIGFCPLYTLLGLNTGCETNTPE
ncbi:MAG: DUF2892 domain-containing protein [Campylobacterales bacterium]|nr:DUF2892 domain-containing protein [Campylobacterales bacterium]